MKRGQITAEIVAYVGLFLVFLITLSFYLFNAFNTDLKNQQYLRARGAAEQIGNYFLLLVNSGEGSSINITLPPSIFSSAGAKKDYYILISNNGWLYIVYKNPSGQTFSQEDEPMFSYPIGFKNFVCKSSSTLNPSCIKSSNILIIDPSNGWVFLNYSSNKIEVE
ncbi:MAG: hypothetical protein QXV83_04050 [Candidatus Anstonellaceae archaeon]